MPTLPKLTEQDIRNWTNPDYFKRGLSYYRRGYIYNPRRTGTTIKGHCQGSMPEPYRIHITLGPTGISSGECSCPIGDGGYCKHAVALLLTWVYAPASFTETAAIEDVLRESSPEELIALILRMLERAPELESLVELEVLAVQADDAGLDPARIQQQVWHALRSGRGDWRDGYHIADQLHDILGLADRALELGHWQSAITVYTTVAETVLEGYEEVYDDEGDLFGVINTCLSGLGECLPHIEDEIAREHLLRELFRYYEWDLRVSGYGVGDEVPAIIEERTTAAERVLVAQWVRATLPQIREWGRQALGGFLLRLEADVLDDEAYLRLCRESGRVHDLVTRLLTLGRIEESLAEAQAASDYDLWQMGDLFQQHGAGSEIAHLIAERALISRDSRLKTWLKNYAIAQNDPESILQWTQVLLEERPSLELYAELKAAALARGNWERIREELFVKLADRKLDFLIQVHLYEDEFDAALSALAHLEHKSQMARGGYYHPSPLRIQVATAVAKTHPQAAIDLYMLEIQRSIDARGRDNYAQAAQYLRRVCELYHALGEAEQGESLIYHLRAANKNLRAMQDEFDKAGLGGNP